MHDQNGIPVAKMFINWISEPKVSKVLEVITFGIGHGKFSTTLLLKIFVVKYVFQTTASGYLVFVLRIAGQGREISDFTSTKVFQMDETSDTPI